MCDIIFSLSDYLSFSCMAFYIMKGDVWSVMSDSDSGGQWGMCVMVIPHSPPTYPSLPTTPYCTFAYTFWKHGWWCCLETSLALAFFAFVCLFVWHLTFDDIWHCAFWHFFLYAFLYTFGFWQCWVAWWSAGWWPGQGSLTHLWTGIQKYIAALTAYILHICHHTTTTCHHARFFCLMLPCTFSP